MNYYFNYTSLFEIANNFANLFQAYRLRQNIKNSNFKYVFKLYFNYLLVYL